MALTPQNDEAFLREVDEELRREQIGTFWRRYGRLMVLAVVLALAAFGGFLWWQANSERKSGITGENMTTALEALGKGRIDEARKSLGEIAEGDNKGYSAAARLALAAHLTEAGDGAGAAKAYAAIAADDKVAQPFRDLATIRGVATEFDTLKPETAIDRLKPLAVPGGSWFGSAGEMTAIAWLKLGRQDKAGAIFAAVAKDSSVPATIRSRATRIAGALGADVAAPVPGKEFN